MFIDADKVNYPQYLEWAVRLCRPGTLIIDNVVRDDEVANATSTDASVQAVRRTMSSLQKDKRVDTTAIQTVGVKGYDGFAAVTVK